MRANRNFQISVIVATVLKLICVTLVALHFIVASTIPLYADSDLNQDAHIKITVGNETRELPLIFNQKENGVIRASSEENFVFGNDNKITVNYLLEENPNLILTFGVEFKTLNPSPTPFIFSTLLPLLDPIEGDSVPAVCEIAGIFADGTSPPDGVSVTPVDNSLLACEINNIGVINVGSEFSSHLGITTYPQDGGSFSASKLIDCDTIDSDGTCNHVGMIIAGQFSAGSDHFALIGRFCLNEEACLGGPLKMFSEIVQGLIPDVLTEEIGHGMIEKLDEALDKLDDENPPADKVAEACNQLTALFTQITMLINTDEAGLLLEILRAIMTDPDVECPVPTE